MVKPTLNREVFTDASWWHWATTIPLLAAHLVGYPWALPATMVLCAAVGVYFLIRIGQLRPYPVQVRFAYLGLLAAGTLPGFGWIHWVQIAGTTAMVTVGYCPLIRALSLLPPNRSEPLTPSFVWQTFVKEPCVGGVAKWPLKSSSSTIARCALPADHAGPTCSLPSSTLKRKERHYATAH